MIVTSNSPFLLPRSSAFQTVHQPQASPARFFTEVGFAVARGGLKEAHLNFNPSAKDRANALLGRDRVREPGRRLSIRKRSCYALESCGA